MNIVHGVCACACVCAWMRAWVCARLNVYVQSVKWLSHTCSVL